MSAAIATPVVTARAFDRTVRQILRVNYAGEYGAIRIYGAQIAVARRLFPAVASFLEQTVAHERRHADAFRALMPSRGTRPCAMTPFWGIGGSVLGALTGLMGADAMMICTQAVERTVHAHLNKQLAFLAGRDDMLVRTIAEIRDEEVGHHDEAQVRQTSQGAVLHTLDISVATLTWLLIWCSTYGALTRMRSGMANE